jgi:tetratricopeptide (TPR) repeat protein
MQKNLQHQQSSLSCQEAFSTGCYAAMGDQERAAADYQAVLAQEPANAEAHLRLGHVYAMWGQKERSLEEYERAVALDPADRSGQRAHAGRAAYSLFAASKYIDEGRSLYWLQKAMKYDARHRSAYARKAAEVLLRLAKQSDKQPAKAAEWLGRAVEFDADNPMYRHLRAMAWRRVGEWDKALGDYTALLTQSQQDGAYRLGRSVCRSARGEIDKGDTDYAAAAAHSGVLAFEGQAAEVAPWRDETTGLTAWLKDGRDDWWLYRARGLAYAVDNKWGEALGNFVKATERKADDVESWRSIARARLQLKDPAGALAACDKVLPSCKNDAFLWHLRGQAARALGRYDEAVRSFTEALKHDSAPVVVWKERGHAHAACGRWKEAVADYGAALERRPDDLTLWTQYGLAQCGKEDFAAFQQTCEQLVKRHGGTHEAADANAVAYLCCLRSEAVKDAGRLVEMAERAAATAPDRADYLEILGMALYRAGQFPFARDRLEMAVKLHQEGGTVWMQLFLAMTYHRLGEHDEARKWLTKAVEQIKQIESSTSDSGKQLDWNWRVRSRLVRQEAEALLRKPLP